MDGRRADYRGTWTSEEQTLAFGQRFAHNARAGDVLALSGELGSGKTTLARYIAGAIGVDVASQFSSPTYCYANEYAGRLPVVHMDLYRVDDDETAEALGLLELMARGDALVVVEWANKLPACLPPHSLWLALSAPNPDAPVRDWHAFGPPATCSRLLSRSPQKMAHP